MHDKWRLEIVLILLVVITLLAIAFEKTILRTELTILPNDGHKVATYTDELSNGNSLAPLLSAENYQWQCDLRNQFAYPYCGFEIFPGKDFTQGVNLNDFNTVKVWLDYKGNSETLRLYLRNFDPVYSHKDIQKSTKYNQLEFSTKLLSQQPITFSMQDFFVANWWLLEQKIDPELSHPQFDNIVIMEVHTGSQHPLGLHEFQLHRIELSGQLFTTEEWYRGIMTTWLVGFVIFILYRIITLGREIQLQKQRAAELMEINALLDARSREMEEKSKTDSLTGAFNRGGIEEAISIGLKEWRHQQKPLSLILIDIDHFKHINDTYGHTTGDLVLTELSQLIKQHVRNNDLFARWGGEEFVLFCRNADAAQTGQVAEKIRTLIEQHSFPHNIKVTASMGIATLQTNEALEQLFNRADEALYEAKNGGRNQLKIAA
jgi:diguanylate cyclase (GGDEF)-like protein